MTANSVTRANSASGLIKILSKRVGIFFHFLVLKQLPKKIMEALKNLTKTAL